MFPATPLAYRNAVHMEHSTNRTKAITNLSYHLLDRQATLIELYRSLDILGCHRLLSK
jgi:hypothetical protein